MGFSNIGFSNVNTAICQYDDTAKMDRCSVEVVPTSVAFMLIQGGSFIKNNVARLISAQLLYRRDVRPIRGAHHTIIHQLMLVQKPAELGSERNFKPCCKGMFVHIMLIQGWWLSLNVLCKTRQHWPI